MTQISILLKILLAGLIMLTSILAKSQEYHPLIAENKQWVIKETTLVLPGNLVKIEYFFHFFKGDSTINQFTYHKFYRQLFHSEDLWYGITLSVNDTLRQPELIGLYREDIEARMLFRKPSFPCDTSEVLWYDFSLGVGDFIPADCASIHHIFKVEFVDSMRLMNDQYRRAQRINTEDNFGDTVYHIQGIGSINGVERQIEGVIVGEAGDRACCLSQLECYLENDENIFGQCDYPDFVVVDAVDIRHLHPNPQIYPNPAMDHTVIIHHTDEPLQMYIRDIKGILFKTTKIFPNIEERINTSDLQPGVYIIHLQGSKGAYSYQKLIINP